MAHDTRWIMPRSHTLQKLCRVKDLLRECFEQPLTLEDLGMEAELSSWHLLRAFRAAFGMTPHEFLTRVRLERAKELLTTTGRPVTAICFDVGFTSLGSFSWLFRRHTGLSPAQFRRQVRAWVTVPGRFPWAFVPFCFWKRFGPLASAEMTVSQIHERSLGRSEAARLLRSQ